MNKNLPLVSIVTPSYNQGKFIEDTILSVKNQDYPNIEHVIVDGGSTDNTLKILKKYEGTYNMHWISEPDEGQSDAVNKGFRMAKGEIIGWLNSDDVYFYKKVFSDIVNEFQNFPDVDLIYGDAVIISENNLILRIVKMSHWAWNYPLLRRGLPLAEPSVFFRKKVLLSNRINKNLEYTMDFEFWLRLIQNGYNFRYLDRILSGDRFHKKKKSFYHRDLLEIEKMEVLKEYGQKINFNFHMLCFMDKIYVAIARKLLGCKDILLKVDMYNLAFEAELPSKFVRIKNQLCLLKTLKDIVSLIK